MYYLGTENYYTGDTILMICIIHYYEHTHLQENRILAVYPV